MFNLLVGLLIATTGCQNTEETVGLKPTEKAAKSYWYSGEAEISSYDLVQARYGEKHRGEAVMVFVTEPYSKKTWTKADNPNEDDVPVLKLNYTKKFNTGIYPYSMMTSTFFPFENGKHAVKISASMQEWCGHSYMELRNKKEFEVRIDSYFEGESNESLKLSKAYLEDDFWTIIRLNPENLPVGKVAIIPSFFYLRLSHEPFKAYTCETEYIQGVRESSYKLNYPTLNRSKIIRFETDFPHQILSWEETNYSGWGEGRKELTTTATLKASIRSAYWNKNTVADSTYRQQLKLD